MFSMTFQSPPKVTAPVAVETVKKETAIEQKETAIKKETAVEQETVTLNPDPPEPPTVTPKPHPENCPPCTCIIKVSHSLPLLFKKVESVKYKFIKIVAEVCIDLSNVT
jgi:hypothetical protein